MSSGLLFSDVATPFSDGMSAVQLNRKWGYVDKQGKMLIPPQYKSPSLFSEGLADTPDAEGKVGYIDHQGQWVIAPQFYLGDVFIAGRALVSDKLQQSQRYIDKAGRTVLEPQADVRYSSNRWHKIQLVNKKTQYYRLSRDGETLNTFLPFKAEDALKDYPLSLTLFRRGDSTEGLIPACSLSLCGYVNYDGQWVIAPKFKEVGKFFQGRAIVSENDLKGMIDREGRWVIGPMPAQDFKVYLPGNEGAYGVIVDNQGREQIKTGWFDDHGDFVTAPLNTPRYSLPEGWHYTVDAEGIADIVDRNGQSLIQPAWSRDVGEQQPRRFSIIRVFPASSSENVRSIVLSYTPQAAENDEDADPHLLVFLPGESRILVQDWKFIMESFPVVRLSTESHGSYSSDSPDILLFADTGEYLWDKKISHIQMFENQAGFAQLMTSDDSSYSMGGYVLIDRQGRYLLEQQQFRDVERNFSSGIAWARSAETWLWGAIDNTGKPVIPFEYIEASPFQGNYAFVQTNDKESWAIDRENNRYDWVQNIARLEAHVTKSDAFIFEDHEGGRGLIRGDGTILIPAGKYDNITPIALERLKVRLGDNEGMTDLTGREIIPPEYKHITAVDDNSVFDSEKQIHFFTLTHSQTHRKAVVDAEGRFLTDFDIQSTQGSLTNGILLVSNDRIRMLLPDGQLLPIPSTLLTSNQVDHYQLLDDGTILVELGDVSALSDPQGRPISAWYQSLNYVEPGLWLGRDRFGTSVLDAKGKRLYFLSGDRGSILGVVHDTSDKRPRALLVAEMKDIPRGAEETVLIDLHDGQIVQTLPRHMHLLEQTIVDNLIPVGDNNWDGKAGFYDLQGNLRISIQGFIPTGVFRDHRTIMISDALHKNGMPLQGIIDTRGRWIVKPGLYIDIEPYSEKRTWARTGSGEFHLLDTQGRVLGKIARRCNQDVWLNAKGKVEWPKDFSATCQ